MTEGQIAQLESQGGRFGTNNLRVTLYAVVCIGHRTSQYSV